GSYIDGDRFVRAVVDRRAIRLVVLALERHPLLGPELSDQLDRLAEHSPALLDARPSARRSRRLIQRLAGTDAEEDAPRVEARERRKVLRDDRRVIAHGRC